MQITNLPAFSSARSINPTQVLAALERATQTSKGLWKAHRNAMADQRGIAEERLERAKQILEMLKRLHFPADVIAKRAAELGIQVESAARDFAAAAGEASETSVNPGTVAPLGEQAAEDTQLQQPAQDERPQEQFVRNAYLETMNLRSDRQTLSADDSRIIAQFQAVAREIKTLFEKALRELREKQPA